MRTLKFIGVLGVGLACCIAIAQEPTKSSDHGAISEDAKVWVMTYVLADLPVWKKDGTCDPSVLIRLIELSINPNSWEAQGGSSSMAAYSQNASLIVKTNSANHDAIVDLLEQLRR